MGRRGVAEAPRAEQRPDEEEAVRKASLSVMGGLQATLRWEQANEGAFRHVPRLTTFVCDEQRRASIRAAALQAPCLYRREGVPV